MKPVARSRAFPGNAHHGVIHTPGRGIRPRDLISAVSPDRVENDGEIAEKPDATSAPATLAMYSTRTGRDSTTCPSASTTGCSIAARIPAIEDDMANGTADPSLRAIKIHQTI